MTECCYALLRWEHMALDAVAIDYFRSAPERLQPLGAFTLACSAWPLLPPAVAKVVTILRWAHKRASADVTAHGTPQQDMVRVTAQGSALLRAWRATRQRVCVLVRGTRRMCCESLRPVVLNYTRCVDDPF